MKYSRKIRAKDVEVRSTYTDEQRKNILPLVKNDKTVYIRSNNSMKEGASNVDNGSARYKTYTMESRKDGNTGNDRLPSRNSNTSERNGIFRDSKQETTKDKRGTSENIRSNNLKNSDESSFFTDNKVFNIKDRRAEKNYPPIHPSVRCTTVAVFDDKITDDLERIAKDENGELIPVPQNISYKQWAMQYAPELYKEYYINPDLPKIKISEDSILEKQLGFYNEDHNLRFIPKNVIISNVHIIAGKGTQTVFRSANKYAQQYGGKAEEWMKKVGKIESSKYIFDIHWVEHEKYGKYDSKIGGKKLK